MDYSPEALRFRLHALSCPLPVPAAAARATPLQLQRLVAWLEDTHIRRLRVADRTALRGQSATFASALTSYLAALPALPHATVPQLPRCDGGVPVDVLLTVVAYLTDYALALHYDDRFASPPDPPPPAALADPWRGNSVPVVPGAGDDAGVAAAATDLLRALGHDTDVLARVTAVDAAAALHVAADQAEQLSAAAAAAQASDRRVTRSGSGSGSKQTDLPDLPPDAAGLSTGDEALDCVAAATRALLVRRLRSMQLQVNDMLTELQAVTADPKTNSKLGAVGR